MQVLGINFCDQEVQGITLWPGGIGGKKAGEREIGETEEEGGRQRKREKEMQRQKLLCG